MRAVDDHRVPLAERAAAGVLAGQPDRAALEQQRAEREQLADGPVDRALADHRGAALQLRQQLRVHGEAVRQRDVASAIRFRTSGVIGGRPACGLRPAAGARRGHASPAVRAGVAGLGEDPLELLLVVAQRLLGLLDA